jgi:TPP-dependent pyruvate/acetoin dehydrogenase alpha subunit
MKLSKEKIKEIYLLMKRCRAFEERSILELRKGMPGFIHSSVGAEAIPCGISPFLSPGDYMLTTHRGHSDIIARGASFKATMAELYAKETGYCRGVSGSMHIAALDLNILGATAIVGSGVPLASGVALGCKLKKSDQITVCYFGDGATCTGAFHEGVTFAAAFDLPVLFVLVNNQYEESTHWTYWGGKLKNLAERAKGYGIPGISVDGNDAIAVAEVASKIIPQIRKGGGPVLLEGMTYRIYGHHMGDPGTTYRSKEEVEEWKSPEKDPISRLLSYLLKESILTETENQDIDVQLERELDEAVTFAINSREIEPEDAFRNSVYSGREVDSLQKVWRA